MGGEGAVKQPGVNYDVVENPKGTTGKNHLYANPDGWTLMKISKRQDATWKFMAFMLTEQGQIRVSEGGRLPGVPEYIESVWVALAQEIYNCQNAKAFATCMEEGFPALITGEGFTTGDVYDKAMNPARDMMFLGTSAKEALTEADGILQTLIDAYWMKR